MMPVRRSLVLSKGSWLLGIALVLVGTSVSYAQAEPAELPRLTEEVAGVNRSLDRLVGLLVTMLEQQKTDLLLKRIEMKERRVLPLEQEMRRARNTASNIGVEIDRMQAMIDDAESSQRKALRDGREREGKELDQMITQLSLNYDVEVASRDEHERRARDLEDQIALHRRDIEVLDDLLMEQLGE